MIHPDAQQRRDGLRRLAVLAAAAHHLGTRVLTLCTGSRDPGNMWRRHPDNDTPAAWHDLALSMAEALRIAEDHDVILGIEPEVSNTVDSAAKARRLLDGCGSPRLKIIMDPANLFHHGELPRMRDIIADAFELLGGDLILAHAKDLSADGRAGQEAAGTGLLDYDVYLGLLRQYDFRGPLILHSLTEAQVDASRRFLRQKLGLEAI
jgi:sugar phosphate isomerase/epimerase